MEAIEQKVRDILKLQFKDAEIEFDRDLGTPLLGRIVSEKFEGLDNEARDKMIWTPLRALLTSKERQQILNFLAYTPAEEKMYAEAFDGPPREELPLEAMRAIEQKVKNVLKRQFTDEEIRFDHKPGERISGFIVSEKFLDMEPKDRHAIIWNLLETHLTPEERRQVLGFLAFTPWEEEARSEDLAFAD